MSLSKEITEDFLEADDAIRGQNYVCLSFISPENVLQNKELFLMRKFLKHLVKENNIKLSEDFINNIGEKYKDYLYLRKDEFEKEFHQNNDFQTTVRGLKVRGVYDSLREAQIRAKVLQRKDKNFNVFVGQVGFWLPWDPAPHNVEGQEYFESELNELVKKYKENQENKDIHFRENVEYVKEQAQKKADEEREKRAADEGEGSEDNDTKDAIDIANTELPSSNNQISQDIQKSLESDDPWMAAKKRLEESEDANDKVINDTQESQNV